jgi:hypothetical protein
MFHRFLMSDVFDIILFVGCPELWEAKKLCSGTGCGMDQLLEPRRWAIFQTGRIPTASPSVELMGRLNAYFWQLDPASRPPSSVERVSLLLGKSRQQIRRYFGMLKKRGEILTDSFDGYRWNISDEDFVRLVKELCAPNFRRREKPAPDLTEIRLTEFGLAYRERTERDRKQNQVRKFERAYLNENPGMGEFPNETERLLDKGAPQLAALLYVARIERPNAPLSWVAESLGESRTTFWRRHRGEMREALRIVHRLAPPREVTSSQPQSPARKRYGSDGEIAA